MAEPPFALPGRTSETVVLRQMVQDPARRDAALLSAAAVRGLLVLADDLPWFDDTGLSSA